MSVTINRQSGLLPGGTIVVRDAVGGGNFKYRGTVTDGGPGDRDGKKNGSITFDGLPNLQTVVQVNNRGSKRFGDANAFWRIKQDAKGKVAWQQKQAVARIYDVMGMKEGATIELRDLSGRRLATLSDNNPLQDMDESGNIKFSTFVKAGWSGLIDIRNRDGTVLRWRWDKAGAGKKAGERLRLLGKKGGAAGTTKPKPRPVGAPATLQMDNVYGYAKFRMDGKAYAVVDQNDQRIVAQLRKRGFNVLADTSAARGTIRFGQNQLRETSVITDGTVVPDRNPNAVHWRFTARGIGTPNAKVTVSDFRGQPRPGTFVNTTATPTVNTDDAKNASAVSVLAQPAGNLRNMLETSISSVKTSVASAIADMKAFRMGNDYRSMSGDLEALQGMLFTHMGNVMDQFSRASKAFAENKDAFFTPAMLKSFDSQFAELRELVNGQLMEVAQNLLDKVADKAVNNAGAFYNEMKKERASRVLNIINGVMGVAFLGLGWANGVKAYLPTVVAGRQAGSVDSLGLWLARGAVHSGLGASIPQVMNLNKADKEFFAKTRTPGRVDIPSGAQAWETLTKGLEKMPLVQRLRSMMVKFQVDVAAAGPYLLGDPRVPGGKNPAWDDQLGYVKTIGQITNGQDGTNFKHWRFRDDTKWLGNFATGLAKDQKFLFENSARGGMSGSGGTMKGLRRSNQPPSWMPFDGIGVFTRERPAHEGTIFTGSDRKERLELKVVLPWMGVR